MMARTKKITAGLTRAGASVAVAVALAALPWTPGVAEAKPLTITPPSWAHATTPPPLGKPLSQPKFNHRLPAESAGWGASAERTANADTAITPVPPLPDRKPKEWRGATTAAVTPAVPAPTIPRATPHATAAKTAAAPAMPVAAPPSSLDVAVTEVLGEEEKPHQPAQSATPQPAAQPPAVNKTPGAQYCDNISNAASDARYAWQKKLLLETEQEVSKRIEELNAKIAEYQKWLARRDEFTRKAQGVVVDIYTKMKPDAAAQQLTILDEEMAAAVLTKLSPKVASAVMNEMNPKTAARLTSIISGSTKGPTNAAPPAKGGGT